VEIKTKSLFGESAPYFSKVNNLRGLESKEEQWIKSFNLKEQPEKTSIETKHENWEIRLKEEEFGEWKRQRKKHLLFFDGASKGNPEATGGGGVLVAPDGKLELSYAWGLGEESNNQAKALALWQGLNQAISKQVNELVIIGDSKLIIQALILHNPVKQTKLQHILEKTHHLLKRFRAFQLFHILRNMNEKADKEANIGVTLSKGEIQINGILSHKARVGKGGQLSFNRIHELARTLTDKAEKNGSRRLKERQIRLDTGRTKTRQEAGSREKAINWEKWAQRKTNNRHEHHGLGKVDLSESSDSREIVPDRKGTATMDKIPDPEGSDLNIVQKGERPRGKWKKKILLQRRLSKR
jgi:ribonuclease HI